MEFIYVGKYVNTHGIKGEIRILSDFKYKDKIFKNGFKIYIGKDKKECEINTYRVHKNYDMVTLKGYNDINQVLPFKGSNVYILRNSIEIDGYFDEDIIGLEAYTDHYIGTVKEILKGKANDILVIKNEKNQNLIPFIDEFIDNIDLQNNKIYIKEIEGLINEN